MIKLSVALPVYNSKDIVWLALEGLAQQEDCGVRWELLIAEEQGSNALGETQFREFYNSRLKDKGCDRFYYEAIKTWIPLSKKWQILGNNASETSKIFLLQAADCYPHPNRLKMTYDAMVEDKFDWYNQENGYFYDINLDKTIEYKQNLLDKPYPTGLNMAFRTLYAKQLPNADVRKGVDAWLYNCVRRISGNEPLVYWDNVSGLRNGIDTNGMNNISLKRVRNFIDPVEPFKKGEYLGRDANIKDFVPLAVAERLLTIGNKIREEMSWFKIQMDRYNVMQNLPIITNLVRQRED